MSIWSVLIYSFARKFKSDSIKNKVLKTLLGLQKIKYRLLMSQECLSGKQRDNSIIMVNLWKCFIRFKNVSDLSHTNFRKPFFSALSSLALSHSNSDSLKSSLSITSSEPWYSLWTTAIFSGKYSFVQMMLPLTSQLQSWGGGS